MSNEFAAASLTMGQMNALVKILNKAGGIGSVTKILKGEMVVKLTDITLAVNVLWNKRDGIVYFSLSSRGWTGEEWLDHFARKGIGIGDPMIEKFLLSKDFHPSKERTRYGIAVLGSDLFTEKRCITSVVREVAHHFNFIEPNIEVSLLIRDSFTEEEIRKMGFVWIMAMHEPIKDSENNLYFFTTTGNCGRPCLGVSKETKESSRFTWVKTHGFAFLISKINPPGY